VLQAVGRELLRRMDWLPQRTNAILRTIRGATAYLPPNPTPAPLTNTLISAVGVGLGGWHRISEEVGEINRYVSEEALLLVVGA
jgi:hypothetical protein